MFNNEPLTNNNFSGPSPVVYISPDYQRQILPRLGLRLLSALFCGVFLVSSLGAQFFWAYAEGDCHMPITAPITLPVNISCGNHSVPPVTSPITYPLTPTPEPNPITAPITSPIITLTPTPTETPMSPDSNTSSNNSNASNPAVCNDLRPSSAPELTSIKVINSSEVELDWTKAGDPVSYYIVTYGLEPGKPIYGITHLGDSNTTSVIIGDLYANMSYYFTVSAVNGCAVGEASNELEVKINSASHSLVNHSQNNVLAVEKTTGSSNNTPAEQTASSHNNHPKNSTTSNNIFNLIWNFLKRLNPF